MHRRSHIEKWLGALKSDKEVIFKAASEAQKVLDYINNLTNQTQEQEAA